MLSLGSYLNSIDRVLEIAALKDSGSSDGWKTSRSAVSTRSGPVLGAGLTLQARNRTPDQVLRTLTLSSETLVDAPSINGAPLRPSNNANIWYDNGVGREVSGEMREIRGILGDVFESICDTYGGKDFTTKHRDPNMWLMHVNDLPHTAAMTRSSVDKASIMGGRMALISPTGVVYCVTIDRVSTGQAMKFMWTALTIDTKYEICRFEIRNGSVENIPADGYVNTSVGRVALFRFTMQEYSETHQRTHEYGYRKTQHDPDVEERSGGAQIASSLSDLLTKS